MLERGIVARATGLLRRAVVAVSRLLVCGKIPVHYRHKPMLHLTQSSLWNNWRFVIQDASGTRLGEILAPMWTQATNSRLKLARQDAVAAHMNLPGGEHVIRFEYLRRGWTNDVAWWLESPEGEMLARIERVYPQAAKALSCHYLRLPDLGELLITSARTLKPFDAVLRLANGQQVLRISTPGRFLLRLDLVVQGEYGSVAQRAFFAYYALHQR